jgi:acetate CoA/acetoacetate CoA-transferase beta subunit
MDIKQIIAKRAAQEFRDGDIVNLGIGIPTLAADFILKGINVIIHSENGIMGMGGSPAKGQENPNIINAGGAFSSVNSGGMFFDSAYSFGLIRGGHIDMTIMGALEVDEEGNLANWIVPGKMAPGMGGAMDLAVGAKRVIIAMTHTQNGKPKILKKCILPLTAKKVVDLIITEMAVIEVSHQGLILKELQPNFTAAQVQAATEAALILAPTLSS